MTDEDDILRIFEKFNIKLGKVNPRVIKAWFDTDCEDLLKWICTSLSEENYVSPQEEFEYYNIANSLTKDELQKKCDSLNIEFPNLFDYEENVLDIENAKDTIEVLEQQLKDCRHQSQINQRLNQSLLEEFSKLSAEEMKSQLEQENAQENCVKSSMQLDEINTKLFNQIDRYSYYMNNFGLGQYPQYVNAMDVAEFEDKFNDVVSEVNTLAKMEVDAVETGTFCFNEMLSGVESCLFNSKKSLSALQMEIATMNHVTKFLENYNVNSPFSYVDENTILANIDVGKTEQSWMLKMIEASVSKIVRQQADQPMLQCLQMDLDFYQCNLNNLNNIKDIFKKMLTHFTILSGLYLQEKVDINNSKQFFKSVAKYVNNNVRKSGFRNETMLKLVEEYEHFTSNAIENKITIIGEFGGCLASDKQLPLVKILKEFAALKKKIRTEEKKQFDEMYSKTTSDLLSNNRSLHTFLDCGPSSQYIIIPHELHMLFRQVDQCQLAQKSSVKEIMSIVERSKTTFAQNKQLQYRNKLWMLFVTNPTKMLHLVEEPRTNVLRI